MSQNRTIIILIVLAIGFVAGFIMRPVIAPQSGVSAPVRVLGEGEPPRSQQFFEAHLNEARRVVSGCRDGSVRGDECRNAGDAVSRVEGRESTDRFLGKHP